MRPRPITAGSAPASSENVPYDRFVREHAHGQREQLPRGPGQLLPGRAKQDPAGHRPGRGPDVHGHPGPELAQGAPGRDGRLLLADPFQGDGRMERGDRVFRPRPSRPWPGGQAGLSRRHAGPARAGPGPAGRVCRLADLRRENPWFARNIANRAWSWLLGRGHHSRARRHAARQSAQQSRSCWPTWSRRWSPASTT